MASGSIAVDGEILDLPLGKYFVSSAWRDPSCALGLCWRPEKVRMVPPERRICGRHGRAVLPESDPYPLEGRVADGAVDVEAFSY